MFHALQNRKEPDTQGRGIEYRLETFNMAIKLYDDDKESALPHTVDKVASEAPVQQPKRTSWLTSRRIFYAALLWWLYLTYGTQDSLGNDHRLTGIGKQKPGQCAMQPQAIGKGPGMVSRRSWRCATER